MKHRRRSKKFLTPKAMGALFLAVIMLSSVLGFVVMNLGPSTQSNNSYNGYKLVQLNNRWIIDYNGQKLTYFIHPATLENIDFDTVILDSLVNTQSLIVSIDPSVKSPELIPEMRSTFINYFSLKGKSAEFALTQDSYMYDNFIVADCSDSTLAKPVILFKDGTINSIERDDATGCVTVTSTDIAHRIRFYETVSYIMLGIIERN